MGDLGNIFLTWKEIFKNWKYTLISIITALAFYILSAFIFQIRYISAESILSPISLGSSFYNLSSTATFTYTLVIVILTGILFGLLTYRFDNIRKLSKERLGVIPSIGIFLGIAAPGCASCGVGLAAALGLGSALAKLPFKGLEISVLAIFFLTFSIYKISLSFVKCDL